MKRVLVLTGIIIALGIIYYGVTLIPAQPANSNASEPVAATSTLTASTPEYTVEANYPQFGLPTIDSQIKADVEKGITDLESAAEQDQPAENGFPTYDFNSTYDSAYVGPDYVSVRLILAQYTGGAHELPIILGETFHRDTGARVTLDEALALTGMTLGQVAAGAKTQLSQNPDTVPSDIWAQGSDPTAENYSSFIINNDSVTFIFQPYQVAPYSAGAPEVAFPRVK